MNHVAVIGAVVLSALTSINPAGAYTWQVERCAELYMTRNTFYDNKGLCFTRPTAIQYFPNNKFTCTIRNSAYLPMSQKEKQWVDRIVAEERALGCPRI